MKLTPLPRRLIYIIASGVLLVAAAMVGARPIQEHLEITRLLPSPDVQGSPLLERSIRRSPDAELTRKDGESALLFASRATNRIYRSTWHCNPTDFVLTAGERALFESPSRAHLLRQGMLAREWFTCGFCHQRAFLLVEALLNGGVEAKVYGLNGHVVARFEVGGEVYFADPDYGVGPFPAPDGVATEASVKDAYERFGPALAQTVADFYTSTDDNAWYVNGALHEIAAEQRKVLSGYANALRAQSITAIALGSLGLITLVLAAFPRQLSKPFLPLYRKSRQNRHCEQS